MIGLKLKKLNGKKLSTEEAKEAMVSAMKELGYVAVTKEEFEAHQKRKICKK